MNPLLAIAASFNVSASAGQLSEDFESATFKAAATKLKIPSEVEIRNALLGMASRDLLHCDVIIDDGEPISFHSAQPDSIPTFVNQLPDVLSVASADGQTPTVRLEISVEKKLVAGELTLLSLEAIAKYLVATPLKLHLVRFSDLVKHDKTIRFICDDSLKEFRTETFWFINKNPGSKISDVNRGREAIFSKRNEVCHFEEAAEIKAIPEDFFLQDRSGNAAIDEMFDKLCLVTSLIFVADIFEFRAENLVFYKMNGYKSIMGTIDWNALDGSLAGTYFKVYQWIYEGGVINDKIGLARNLLSLHARKGSLLELDDEVFTSIRSGYQIYLKENVEQYIEIKNKLIDFVSELSAKAGKLGENLGDSLSQNFIAFFTFFLSVIIIKAISEKDLTVTFSPKLAFIAYALLVASFCHWIVSLLLLNREIGQMKQTYRAIQNRYADLLDATDLKNALNKDAEFAIIMGNIKFKRCLFSALWITYIIIFAVVVARLGKDEQTPPKLPSIRPAPAASTNQVSKSPAPSGSNTILSLPKH